VPLSARTPGSLRRSAERLAAHVERAGRLPHETLLDLSYTLCRRDHFEYRHAWVVSDPGDLPGLLRSAGDPVRTAPAGQRDAAPDGRPEDAPPPTPEEARRLYLAGGPLDWRGLFAGHEPRRLRLPSYPFDETDLWFTDEGRRP
jgi:polyketide synthase PksJ